MNVTFSNKLNECQHHLLHLADRLAERNLQYQQITIPVHLIRDFVDESLNGLLTYRHTVSEVMETAFSELIVIRTQNGLLGRISDDRLQLHDTPEEYRTMMRSLISVTVGLFEDYLVQLPLSLVHYHAVSEDGRYLMVGLLTNKEG